MKRGKINVKAKRNKGIKIEFLLGIFIILILIIIIGFKTFEKSEKETEEGGKFINKVNEETGELGSYGISRLESYDIRNLKIISYNCSDKNLREVWHSIFDYGSDDMIIVSDKDSQENCNNSLIYKILNDNLTYFIYLKYNEGKSSISGESYNYFGNFTEDFLDFLKGIGSQNLETFYNLINDKLNIAYPKSKMQGNRTINDETSANDEYNSIFKLPIPDWNFINANSNVNGYDLTGPIFYYINLSSNNAKINSFASINPNHTLDYLYYSEYFIKNITMVKIADIPNINLNGSRRHYNVIKLEDYFANLQLTDGNLTFSYSISNPGIFNILKNNYFDINHSLDVDTSSSLGGIYTANITLTYFDSNTTSNNFDININGCLESDSGYDIFVKSTSQNLINSSTDLCSNNSNTAIIEYSCGLNGEIIRNSTQCPLNYVCYDGACIENGSRNTAPIFLADSCDGIVAIKNTNFKIDMRGCFYDYDNDSLTFRYEVLQNGSWIIIRNLTTLTLIPNQNWVGTGRFNIYAKEVFVETKGIVNFEIIGEWAPTPEESPSESEEFKILNPYPLSENFVISENQSIEFSIGNTEYDSIEWYLDGLLVNSNSAYFNVNNWINGTHIVKVDIRMGEFTASKTWTLVVRTPEEQKQYIIGKIVFWLLIMIFSVLIILIALLIIRERKKLKTNSLR